MVIKNRKIVTIGDSQGFIVPKQYFTDGVIDENKRYDVEIKESKKK